MNRLVPVRDEPRARVDARLFHDGLVVRRGGAAALTLRGQELIEPLRETLCGAAQLVDCRDGSGRQLRGVSLLGHRVAAQMRSMLDLRIEEFPCALPGLGIDVVWNPHLGDQWFVAWLREILLEAAETR